MTPEQLEELCNKHLTDVNYQYRRDDSNWDEIDKLAEKSFNRLPQEHKDKLANVLKTYGKKADGEVIDPKLVLRYRFMAQTNLFFLCKLLEKYRDTSAATYTWTDGKVHNTHEEICNQFFVRKNPTKSNFKEFAAWYESEGKGKKERLLLVPRGGFKSSIDMADVVQWVVCFPEITILVLTGVLSLANDFVAEIKGHFTLEDGGSPDVFGKKALQPRRMHDGSRSMFQVLFPEHCVPADDGKGYEYQTPAVSMVEKETTVFAASIEQNLAGWHVCVLKLDDVVTEENSQTVDRMRNINKKVSIDKAILHPFGFYDKIGTWYDSEDTYGQDIKNRDKYNTEGETYPMEVYIRAAWWANEAARMAGKIEDEMTATDYDLWFNEPGNPHSLTYEKLRYLRKTDPWFAIKYLNDPTQMHVIKFPRELLVRRTVNAAELPGTGMIVTCIDTAYSTKSWADYTVILTALIYGGRFYIMDMKRGKYNEYELPAMIAATALQWRPKRICIEDTGKAEKYVQREVYREMDKLKIRVPIQMVTLGQGSKASSKKTKAGPVLRYLGDDRLRFLNTVPSLEDLYDELSRFGTAASTHDDIVDALAILVNEFSAYADIEGKMTEASSGYVYDAKAKTFYDQTYGDGKFAKYNAQNSALEFPDMAPSQLAQQAAMDAIEAAQNPLSDLFS